MRYLTIIFLAVLVLLVGPPTAQSAIPVYRQTLEVASNGPIWGTAARPACWLTPELCKQLGYPQYTRVVSRRTAKAVVTRRTAKAVVTRTTRRSVVSRTTMKAYVTGYGYWDNTPAGSSAISNPVLHKVAGGVGTYSNPITVAVGHSLVNGKDILDVPQGNRFYVPNEQRYFIVEDTCGDGPRPQNGPCHSLAQADPGAQIWIDIWVGGAGGTQVTSDACESKLTGIHTIVKNPPSNYKVTPGSISGATCSAGFGEISRVR